MSGSGIPCVSRASDSVSEGRYVMYSETVQGVLSIGSQVVVVIGSLVVDYHVVNDLGLPYATMVLVVSRAVVVHFICISDHAVAALYVICQGVIEDIVFVVLFIFVRIGQVRCTPRDDRVNEVGSFVRQLEDIYAITSEFGLERVEIGTLTCDEGIMSVSAPNVHTILTHGSCFFFLKGRVLFDHISDDGITSVD